MNTYLYKSVVKMPTIDTLHTYNVFVSLNFLQILHLKKYIYLKMLNLSHNFIYLKTNIMKATKLVIIATCYYKQLVIIDCILHAIILGI